MRIFRTLAAAGALLALVGGCATTFTPSPRPAVVTPMNIAKKQEYIRGAKMILKNFQSAAIDLGSRRKPMARRELAGEVERYIALQVEPIVDDFEAGNNLETRLEIGKLQLLCALVYLELAEYREARQMLGEMNRRYGDSPDFLNAAIDRNDIGFGNLEDGMRNLKERLSRESPSLLAPLPPRPSVPLS